MNTVKDCTGCPPKDSRGRSPSSALACSSAHTFRAPRPEEQERTWGCHVSYRASVVMRVNSTIVERKHLPCRNAGPRVSSATSAAPASRYTSEPCMSAARSKKGCLAASIRLSTIAQKAVVASVIIPDVAVPTTETWLAASSLSTPWRTRQALLLKTMSLPTAAEL